jgi:hypothetical protein
MEEKKSNDVDLNSIQEIKITQIQIPAWILFIRKTIEENEKK